MGLLPRLLKHRFFGPGSEGCMLPLIGMLPGRTPSPPPVTLMDLFFPLVARRT
ncbi:hypothetical protein FA13DRAFT_1741336, partial [Coprinellus micaceus]